MWYIRKRIMHLQENEIVSYHQDMRTSIVELAKLIDQLKKNGVQVIAQTEDSALCFDENNVMIAYAIQKAKLADCKNSV